MEPFDPQDAVTSIRELEVQVRRLRALQVEQLSLIDRRGLHRLDGHASAKVMVRHCANVSNAEAVRRNGACRALRDLPEVRAAFAAGRVGFCQVDRIARAHATPGSVSNCAPRMGRWRTWRPGRACALRRPADRLGGAGRRGRHL